MDPAMWPLLYLGAVPLALFLSVFSLFQFSQMYTLIARAGQKAAAAGLWRYAKPYHKKLVRTLVVVLGEHDQFLAKVQPTHVILVAILIVLLIQLERLIWQLTASAASSSSAGRRH